MKLETQSDRRKAIEYIEAEANTGRKAVSYKASEILNDRIKPYVIAELRNQFSEETVKELPIVSSVNVAKRVVNQLACIYKEAPKRVWPDMTDDQQGILEGVYSDMMANKKLNLANKVYKNNDQGLIQIIPKDGKLIMRVLKPHQWDAIPDELDSETASAIIISSYDNSSELKESASEPGSATGNTPTYESNTKIYKEKKALDKIGDENKTYLVWTREENYFMNDKGAIIGEPLPNPIGVLPFVEFSMEKEFEYWVRSQNSFANFTIDFCATMTSIAQVVKLQGFAQAYLKGPEDMLAQNIQIGPNYILKLPYDPVANIDCEFGFATPGSDIAGSLAYLETLLTTFLTSNGVDPKTVSMNGEGQTYNSGIERLLSMIEKVSASKEDFDTFERIEQKTWEVIKRWLIALSGSETLDDKYNVGSIAIDSNMIVEYASPEMVKSDMEELEVIQKEIELGIASPVSAIMRRERLTKEQALEKYKEYQDETFGVSDGDNQGQDRRERDETDDQPQGSLQEDTNNAGE